MTKIGNLKTKTADKVMKNLIDKNAALQTIDSMNNLNI